ncbi:hypothetical protein [Flavobacterium johnsoniae]|uniref:Uncharacterized protein n=1 Tax=Flavobacterium johnsoniae (strain ATCC 17061 / DSM 2064 / JCM 8514 / BCRC 14874 / CCUG 350202 / NBRC 14942 / NCIMB 11054 / UW101) TaxID=376686 RepID=A5FE18_FLAJ1|nr:hypothetical protein [Flavobacterium johnsoniae]ABQ06551.1 hypothetical protein Fjoh_3537 [Flavobacterium johnsoniae UW101]WQG82303.1 hypothetical protein SR927_04120 [Flavobacterium johnsoniae UW101]SHK79193.1 hypothetical protein SAMN05444146_2288 [Flavobacterium johnsoniae]
MTIDLSDSEMMLSFTQEMASLGYQYVAFDIEIVNNSNTLEFYRNILDAQEYCCVMTNDAQYFENLPTNSLIKDLEALINSGIDTSCKEAIEITGFANSRERKALSDNNLNTNIMNQKNLEYLKDQLKYTGFGETFDLDLKEKMTQGEKEFKIIRDGVYGADSMNAVLNFKKSDQTDFYFFNSYHVSLQKENSKESLEQTFYINSNGRNITLKEAYNLMEGRSVNKDLKNKDGELYNSWIKIDFKQTDETGNFKLNHYHQNYGYDLEASLAKHSIKELDTPKFKEDLLNSLKKGNLQSVTFVVGGVESKMYIEANPQFKTIKVYDENMQRINHRESKEEKKSIVENQSVSKEQKKSTDLDADSSGTEKKNNNRKSKSHSI